MIHTGVSRIDGVPLTLPFTPGTFLPLMIAIAAVAAAAFASACGPTCRPCRVCQPARMNWTPVGVASWPVSGIGFRPWALSDAITAPARPSLAASTPSILLLLRASIWSKICRPLIGSQSVHWSPACAFLKVPFA